MVFVSYSWIDEKPDQSVLELVAKLRKNGYEAECDVMKIQEQTSINFSEMMAKGLHEAEKVIVVLSEEYKKKADCFRGGVGEEYRYIIGNISKETNKYILVSFERKFEKVKPDFLIRNQVICLDNDEGFNQLLCKLNNMSEYTFPEVNSNKTLPPTQYVSEKKREDNKETYVNQNDVSKKSSIDILNEKILASGKMIADTFGEIVDALVSEPVKKLLYVSSLVDEKEVKVFKDNAIEIIDLNNDIENIKISDSSEIYRYSGILHFESKFDECMNRFVELSTEIRNIKIKSNTSFDNWKSKSYANNVLSAGDYECAVWFKIISAKDERYIVQTMIIEEGRYEGLQS